MHEELEHETLRFCNYGPQFVKVCVKTDQYSSIYFAYEIIFERKKTTVHLKSSILVSST